MARDTRKLAAVAFADIAGYTALMQQDEEGARLLVNKFRKVIQAETARHHGAIVNFYGDGCVFTFDSAVNAVLCAQDIQKTFLEHPRVPVRIGLNSGDVYFEENNIYGDGVNLASRIQSAAVPGSVLFSESIAGAIRNQPGFEPVFLGAFRFKNVSQKMAVYALRHEGFSVPSGQEIRKNIVQSGPVQQILNKARVLSLAAVAVVALAWAVYRGFGPDRGRQIAEGPVHRSSIAVLPFLDLSPKEDQAYFSEGIADEILSQLAKIKELKVIARTTSFSFKNKEMSVKSIGESLKVDYILEGSVKKAENIVSISVRLIDARNETQIWTETYDKDLNNTMELQRDIARSVSLKLQPSLPEIKVTQSINEATDNYEAYELYLKAKFETWRDYNKRASELLSRAIALDSGFAEAYALLAWSYNQLAQEWNEEDQEESHQKALAAIDRAIRLKPENSESYLVRGGIKLYLEYDFKGAEDDFHTAMGLGQWPDAPSSICFCTFIHLFQSTGRFDLAANLLDKVLAFDPQYHRRYTDRGNIEFYSNNWDEAERNLRLGLKANRDAARMLTMLYIQEKKFEAAVEVMEGAVDAHRRHPISVAYLGVAYYRAGKMKEFDEILGELTRRAGNDEKRTPYSMAVLFAGSDQHARALDWLEKAHGKRSPELIDINVSPVFRALKEEPRFIKLKKSIGLI